MMNLDLFEDVHPKWQVVEDLTADQAEAALDLLLLAVYINKDLTREEVEVLTEEWEKLPFVGEPETADELAERMFDTHSTLNKVAENPAMFDDFIDEIAGRLNDEDAQMAIYRLMVIAASADGFDDVELDLCESVGHKFGLAPDTIEDIVRSVWESHEKAVDTEAGREHHTPPLFGSRASRDRSSRPYNNPFTQKL